jgi:hypothetical protein
MFEITQDPKAAGQHWPDVSYRGHNLFDIYCDDKEIGDLISDQGNGLDIDCQESYLGYIPDEDCFLSGWDCWYDDSNDCDHCWGETVDEDTGEECTHCDGNGYLESEDSENFKGCMAKFVIDDTGKLCVLEIIQTHGRMVYSDDVLAAMHTRYPSLVDLRLD